MQEKARGRLHELAHAAGGNQEAGFTQPSLHLFLQICINLPWYKLHKGMGNIEHNKPEFGAHSPVPGQNERPEDAAKHANLPLPGQRPREFAAVRNHLLRRLVQRRHEVGDR